MDRLVEHRRVGNPSQAPGADADPNLTPAHPLPPTRAARLTRSRGIFFQLGGVARPGRWILSALCVAAVTISIVASVRFAEPVFDSAIISGNAGPGLIATTTQAPAFVAPRRGRGPGSH
jgi:hypothetical protein